MSKKIFTSTEVMMLMETIQKEFRVVAEAVMDLKDRVIALEARFTVLENKVDGIFEMVAKNTEDIEMMKIDISDIKAELKAMDSKLDSKPDTKELVKIDKRVTFLESKFKLA